MPAAAPPLKLLCSMRRRLPLPQKAAAARWLAELEPLHPRSLFWRAVTTSTEHMHTEQQIAAARAAPTAALAAMCGATLDRQLEALEAARRGPAASPFWHARLAYEAFNFVLSSVSAHWQGLAPSDAARLLSEADGVLRQVSSAGTLPTAWIEVRLPGDAC